MNRRGTQATSFHAQNYVSGGGAQASFSCTCGRRGMASSHAHADGRGTNHRWSRPHAHMDGGGAQLVTSTCICGWGRGTNHGWPCPHDTCTLLVECVGAGAQVQGHCMVCMCGKLLFTLPCTSEASSSHSHSKLSKNIFFTRFRSHGYCYSVGSLLATYILEGGSKMPMGLHWAWAVGYNQ